MSLIEVATTSQRNISPASDSALVRGIVVPFMGMTGHTDARTVPSRRSDAILSRMR